jgi:hypothetical protein
MTTTTKPKNRYKATRAELEDWYADSQRSLQALQEWFTVSRDPHKQEHTITVAVHSQYSDTPVIYVVTAMGLHRHSGGVAIVAHEDWTDQPVYFEDLVSRWLRDPSPYLQGAAHTLRKLQRDEFAKTLPQAAE